MWAEIAREPHARVLELYRTLLTLRRSDTVLRDSGRATLSARAHGEALVVRRQSQSGLDSRVLVANFGLEALRLAEVSELSAARETLFSLGRVNSDGLASRAAVIVACRD